MTNRILITAFSWLMMTAFLQGQVSFSLPEAIAYGLENSSTIRLQELNILDADEQIMEYKTTGIPKVNASVEYQYFLDIPTQILPDFLSPTVYGILFEEDLLPERDINTDATAPVQFGRNQNLTAGVNLSTMVFDYGWFKGLKAQQMYRDLVQKQLEQSEFDIRANITKAYLAVLVAERNVELLQDNINNLSRIREETSALYENGFAEQLDVDRLDLSLENLTTERDNIQRLIGVSKNLLKFQMGYPIAEEIELKDGFDDLVDHTITESIDLNEPVNFSKRPEYEAILKGLELQEVNQQLIRSGALPRLDAFASYSGTLQRNDLFDSNEAGWFPTSVVGLNLTFPIFDGLNRKTRLDRAKIDMDKTVIQKREFERGMTLEVQNSRIQFINARQTMIANRRALDLAQKIYDVANIKYKEGVGSSLERSQAETDLYAAQNKYINSLYDLIVAKTDLDIALGNL